jgi:phosphoglycolate phosphatase
MPVKALIFDLDGTLVDTVHDLLHATNHSLSTIGRRPLRIDEVRSFVGTGAMNLIDLGARATGQPVDQAKLLELRDAFLAYYSDNIAVDSKMFDGLHALLDEANARGLKMGVCTNKVEHLSIKLLERLGLMPHFGAVVGGDTLPIMKPDPACYHEVARRLGVRTEDTLMFGDSETDIKTAQNAGVPVVAVTFGYTTQPVHAFAPTHVIDHYSEAWPIVERYL